MPLKISGGSPWGLVCATVTAAAITAASGFKRGTGGCGANGGSGGTAASPVEDSYSGVANRGGEGTLSPVTTASSMSYW